MRLFCAIQLILLGHLSYGQSGPQLYTIAAIKQDFGVVTNLDSLTYVDSTCTLYKGKELFSGYVFYQKTANRIYLHQYDNGSPNGYAYQFDQTADTAIFRLTIESLPIDKEQSLWEQRSYYSNGQLSISEVGRIDQCPFSIKFDVIFGASDSKKWPYTTYYENGNVKFDYPNDLQEKGTIKSYYESGQLEFSQTYFQGKAYGKWEQYDENGKCTGRLYVKANKPQRGFWQFEGEKKLRARKIRKMQRESLKK